ncbi:MAG: RES family NAD+ phosphorylase [Cyclobacteriaceae bacterium]
MIVYRICQTYPPTYDPIDGEGASLFGGRWNPKGTPAVYTASSLALARCEIARHVSLDEIPDDFRVYEIDIPDTQQVEPSPLPKGWKNNHDWRTTQAVGAQYLSDLNVLSLKVPSLCDPHSYNLILNPASANYGLVKVVRSYPFEP